MFITKGLQVQAESEQQKPLSSFSLYNKVPDKGKNLKAKNHEGSLLNAISYSGMSVKEISRILILLEIPIPQPLSCLLRFAFPIINLARTEQVS